MRPTALLALAIYVALCAACVGAATVSVANFTDLSAAVAATGVSAVVLQANIVLTAGLTLRGRALAISGNASACAAASPPPPPPNPPPGPGPASSGVDPDAVTAATGSDNVAQAAVPYGGLCTLMLTSARNGRHFTLVGANLTLSQVALIGGSYNRTTQPAGKPGPTPSVSYAYSFTAAASSPNSLYYLGGGAVYADNTSWFAASSSSFAYNSGWPRGGAIASLNTATDAVSLTNCAVTNNDLLPTSVFGTQATPATVAVTFDSKNGETAIAGGGIWAVGGVQLSGCNVSANVVILISRTSSVYGGALFAPYVVASNTTFTSNVVQNFGGAIALGSCVTYTDTSQFPTTSPFKGTCSLTLNGTTFTSNTASNAGGAIFATPDTSAFSSISIANSAFVGNSAGSSSSGTMLSGGAMYLLAANVSISGSSFVNNSVSGSLSQGATRTGGAIAMSRDHAYCGSQGSTYFLQGCPSTGGVLSLSIQSSRFSGNTALDSGGAISMAAQGRAEKGGGLPSSFCVFSVSSTQFSGNSVVNSHGGAILLSNVQIVADRLVCTGNTAPQYGGCIASGVGGGDATGPVSLTSSSFSANSAAWGGAFAVNCNRQDSISTQPDYYLKQGAACNETLLVSNTSFSANSATYLGGALFVLSGGSLRIQSGSVLSGNSVLGAFPAGGALFLADYANDFVSPALLIDASTLSNNSVAFSATVTLGPGEALLQSPIFGAGQGGAVFMTATSASLVGVNSSAFANVIVSGGTRIGGNLAVSGAGLSLYGKVALAVSRSTFVANVASSTGGAVLLQGAGTVASSATAAVTNGSTFSANKAVYGAAMAINHGSVLTAQNSSFLDNSASLGGGVFMLQVGSLAAPNVTLSGVTATRNSALAGALAFTNSSTAILKPSFDSLSVFNNTASCVGNFMATAPVAFNVSFATAALRATVAIGYAVQLWDAFGQAVLGWPSTTATLTPSDATAVSGPVMAYYQSGSANFSSTYLKGPVNSTYAFLFEVQSTYLSAAVTATVSNLSVSISPCRAREVFDVAAELCICAAGSYPDSSTGLCDVCPIGTYSSRGSSACSACDSGTVAVAEGSAACTSCPDNSLSVSNVCACSSGYYDTLFGASDTAPNCATCPTGASCTSGLVAASAGYWRERLTDDVFLVCREGNCLAETVIGPLSSASSSNTTNSSTARRRLLNSSATRVWEATNCVEGNTGPLCGLCLPGYTVQSGVCAVCDPGDSFANWNETFKDLLYIGAIVLGIAAVVLLFFQPLSPALEQLVEAATASATNAAARAKGWLTCACCRKQPEADSTAAAKLEPEADSTAAAKLEPEADSAAAAKVEPKAAAPATTPVPRSAGLKPEHAEHGSTEGAAVRTSDSHVAHHRHEGGAAFQGHHTSAAVDEARSAALGFQLAGEVGYAVGVSNAFGGVGDSEDGDDAGSAGSVFNAADAGINFTDDIQHAIAKAQKMLKIFVNFYQIVTSFLQTLDVPWPSFFVSIMARASVVNLNLVQLPKTACMSPSPNYFKQFNGFTLGLVGFALASLAIWQIGKHVVARFTLRGLSEEEAEDRRARFNSTVLQRVLLVLYLCYPGVSVAIVGMFSCITLKSGDSFLNADLNIQCWDTMHWRYVAAAVAWVFVVPVGVPIVFIRLLNRFHVPQLARLKAHNAWLRECVKKLWEQGIEQPAIDPMLCTVHSISDVHLELLSAVLLKSASVEQAAEILSGALTGVAFEEALEAKAAKEKAALEAEAPPPGFFARAMACIGEVKVRAKARLSHVLGVGVDETLIVTDARREILLQRLLQWAPLSGEMAIPPINWVEEAVGEAPPAGEVDTSAAPPRSSSLSMNELELSAGAVMLSVAKPKVDQYHNIRSEDVNALQEAALKEVGFLCAAYHCGCWYWEVVELARKLILTSLLALVQPGSATQVTIGVIIAFLMLLLNLRLKPYSDDTLNFLNTIAQLNLFFFMFVALLLKVQVDGSQSDSAFFTAIVGAMSVVPVALPIVLKILMKLSTSAGQSRDMRGVKDNMDDGFA